MITQDKMRKIEEDAMNDYISEYISPRKYSNEVLRGDINNWYDVDRYHTYSGSCTVPGDLIKRWIVDHFNQTVDEFLKTSGECTYLNELAKSADLDNDASYYDFVYDKCYDIEEYFWLSDVYEELCNEFFEEHGEVD